MDIFNPYYVIGTRKTIIIFQIEFYYFIYCNKNIQKINQAEFFHVLSQRFSL